MRKRLFSALAALLAGTGLAQGQGYYPPYPPPYAPYPLPYAAPMYPGAYPGAPYPGATYVIPGTPYVPGTAQAPGRATLADPGPGMGRATVSESPKLHGSPPAIVPSAERPAIVISADRPAVAPVAPAGATGPSGGVSTAATLPDSIPARVYVSAPPVAATPVSRTGLFSKWLNHEKAEEASCSSCTSAPVAAGPASTYKREGLFTGLHRRHAEKDAPAHCPCPACATASPCTDACGLACDAGTPLLCNVNEHGQPLVRELERAPRGHCFYAHTEFLYYTIQEQRSPTLFTLTGSTPLSAATVDDGERAAFRTTLGVWIDPEERCALEGSFLWLAHRQQGLVAGAPTITRPFFNLQTGAPANLVVALPGVLTGSASIEEDFRFYTVEVNLRKELCSFGCGHLDLIAGGRHLRLDESLDITTRSVSPLGATNITSDRFGADNEFYGGQLGLDLELSWRCWSFNPWTKVALGCNHQTVSINGNRVLPDANGVPRSVPGGFLTGPSNLGDHDANRFAYVPEAGVNFGYQICPRLRFTLGYSVIGLGRAARPGDQINPSVNLSQLPGIAGPGPVTGPLSPIFGSPQERFFWAHGASAGLEVRW